MKNNKNLSFNRIVNYLNGGSHELAEELHVQHKF